MNDTNLLLAVFIGLSVALGFWQRRAQQRLPDDERLKVMDYQSKAGLWALLPIAVLLAAFTGFIHLHAGSPFPTLAVFMLLLLASSVGRSYIAGKKLAAMGISPAYLRTRFTIAVVRGIAIGSFFALVLWHTRRAIGGG
jgi:hypothetical protein